jgi:3-oxoacyl-[acyl-carrier-protein] synthase II
VGIASFNAIRALSTRNDQPEKASRPFDKDRDGFVPGEGAGVLILEDLEHAKARGVPIRGEVIGFGVTNDAFHAVAPDETGRAPAQCMKNALADAGIAPEQVDYVNAHGTSTGLNDASETRALKMALGEHARQVPVSSTKSMIGHLLGAAGAVEAIATVETLRRALAPPTVGWEERDPDLDLDYVPGEARQLEHRGNGNGSGRLTALSNSFGFGGHNAVLCLAA